MFSPTSPFSLLKVTRDLTQTINKHKQKTYLTTPTHFGSIHSAAKWSCTLLVWYSSNSSQCIQGRNYRENWGVHIREFRSARRISFVNDRTFKRNQSGITENMNMHPSPIIALVTRLSVLMDLTMMRRRVVCEQLIRGNSI